MGRKLRATLLVEGELPQEGLATREIDDGDLMLTLAEPMLGSHPPPLPVATVSARQVWAGLGLTGQAQLQAVLLRIVQEVLRERSA